MRNRVAIWAFVGFIVAACWAFFVLATSPFANERMQGLLPLVWVTCPITLASHHPIGLWSVLIANAATYALVGLIVETLRKHPIHLRTLHA
jgi:hypothetical protein